MKILTFPFAGGNRHSFAFLKQCLPQDIELVVLEYPGRGFRIKEPLLDHIDAILEDALRHTLKEIGKEDYVIYGHSMGALVAYLICHKIGELGLRAPLRLVASGRCAPSVKRERKTHHLPSAEFWDKVAELGGLPDELLKEKALLAFIEPILRADFKVVEEYQCRTLPQLSLPIDVFYGSEEMKEVADVLAWKTETSAVINLYELKGGHFFIYNHAEQIADHFKALSKGQSSKYPPNSCEQQQINCGIHSRP